jgi:ABC-2 type transport system permease protein/sodium transport system permease protein
MVEFRLWRFARKELREILRDKRTVLTLVLMPLLLYPLLTVAFRQFFLTSFAATSRPQVRVGVAPGEEAEVLGHLLEFGRADRPRPASAGVPKGNPPPVGLYASTALEEDLRARRIELGVRLPHAAGLAEPLDRDGPSALTRPVLVELVVLDGSEASRAALEDIQARLTASGAAILRMRLSLAERRVVPMPIDPVVTRLPADQKPDGSTLATLIPLILLLMTITGAVYPAIDLTAGERERGTLEVLMAAPVPRVGLLLAKYVAVLTVALLTALANLGMMTVTILASGLGPLLFGERGLTPAFVLSMLGLLLLFALFFAGVLLAVTSFARSFKEAQAYLIPLMLLSLVPGVMALMPGLSLDGLVAVTPLLNIVLLSRTLFEGTATASTAAVVVLSTLLYAFGAVVLAARMFGAEAVLYAEQGTWSDLFRRPAAPAERATAGGAMLVLALLFPLHFLLSGGLAAVDELTAQDRLVTLTVANVLLFAGLPWLASRWARVNTRTGFSLRGAPALAFAGAGLLGASLWVFTGELLLYLQEWGFTTLSPELRKRLGPLLEQWRALPPEVVLATLAVAPALVEELFFRGYLFAALEKSLRPRDAILASAVLFGLFHVLVTDVLVPERLIPSTLMGLVLGWVRWRSGSVWPGMLLHLAHNGAIVLLALYSEPGAEPQHLPWTWILAAAGGTAVGAALVGLVRPAASPEPSHPASEGQPGEPKDNRS